MHDKQRTAVKSRIASVLPWMLAAALVVAIVLWVWFTGHATRDEFPGALLQAEGLVLTALVFVLGLGQNNLRRTAESVLADARRWEEKLSKAHLEQPEAVSSLRLWDRASADEYALRLGGQPRSREEARQTRRFAQRTVNSWGSGRLDRSFSLYSIQRELDREPGSEAAPSQRRRRFLERERARILREDKAETDAEERAGAKASGLRPLLGRYYVAETTALALLHLVQGFIALIVLLCLLGAIYADWELQTAPPPELWAALIFPAVGATYAALVRTDVRREHTAFAWTVRQSSLVLTYEAESTLCQLADDDRSTNATALKRHLVGLLDRAEASFPGMPWQASVRGRFSLLEAIGEASVVSTKHRLRATSASEGTEPQSEMEPDFFARELKRHLRESGELLGYASTRVDDPVAALAYARLLTLRDAAAPLLDAAGHSLPRPRVDSADPGSVSANADLHVQRALDILENDTTGPLSTIWSGRHRDWIARQRFLWPEDPATVSRLEALLPQEPDVAS